HETAGPDGQDHVSADEEQQDRGDVPGRPQMAAVSNGEPLRPARGDAESGLALAHRSVVQVALGALLARDVRREPAARGLLVAGHAVDARYSQDGSGDDSDARRVPRNGSPAATLAIRRDLRLLRGTRRPEARTEDRLPGMAQHSGAGQPRVPEPAAVPLS